MSYYDYDYYKNNGIGVGWLDISKRIKDTTALALSKNITEYWIQENSNYDVLTHFSESIDDLLNWAEEKQLSFLLVLSIGNNLSRRYQLFHELPRFIKDNPDITLTGHILDKGEDFYEIHHQCFLVNINWWRSAGKPQFGDEEQTSWETLEPIRSEENWHDGYTPHWISRGSKLKVYSGKRPGWNIIDAALKSDKRIYSFDEIIRNSKYYVYPEVENDFHTKISMIYNSLQSYSHFVANTESPPQKKLELDFQGVICTAGGITPLLSSYFAGLKENAKLSVFDFSPLALNIQEKMRHRNFDYRNFKKSFCDMEQNIYNPMFKAVDNIDKMQDIINKLLPEGLEEFINNVWYTLDIRYFNIDLLDIYSLNQILSRHKDDRCLVHLSNILHYQHNAWIFNSTHRYRLEHDLVNVFSKYGNETFYVMQYRPGVNLNWKYTTPKQILENKDRYLKRVKELEILPWINK